VLVSSALFHGFFSSAARVSVWIQLTSVRSLTLTDFRRSLDSNILCGLVRASARYRSAAAWYSVHPGWNRAVTDRKNIMGPYLLFVYDLPAGHMVLA